MCISLAHKRDTTAASRNVWSEEWAVNFQCAEVFVLWPVVQRARRLPWWGAPHLVNFLGSVRGVGGGRGLLVLGSSWWMGELGIGSRRLGWGWPLPVPEASTLALRLAEVLNRAAELSFFRFCYIGRQEKQTKKEVGRAWCSIFKKFSWSFNDYFLTNVPLKVKACNTQQRKHQSLSANQIKMSRKRYVRGRGCWKFSDWKKNGLESKEELDV